MYTLIISNINTGEILSTTEYNTLKEAIESQATEYTEITGQTITEQMIKRFKTLYNNDVPVICRTTKFKIIKK